MPEQVRDLPAQVREARFMPATLDAEAGTVEVMWSTGARVRRYDWWTEQYYDEELEVSTGAVDLSRLNSGSAAVLDSHNTYGGIAAQIGVVERAWIAGGEGRAKIRLSQRPELAGIVADIRAGIIQNISVGYTVRKYEITRTGGEVPVYRAVDWQPTELSFVPVPAESGAGTRAAAQGAPCVFHRADAHPSNRSTAMPTEIPQHSSTSNLGAPSAEVLAERQRISEIRSLAERHTAAGVPELAERAISGGQTLAEFRTALLDQLARADQATGGHHNRQPQEHFISAGPSARGTSELIEAAGDAILLRSGLQVREPHAAARDFRGLVLSDVAKMCVERAHRSLPDQRPATAIRMAMTTSDFPAILENALNKALRAGVEVEASSHRVWCAITEAQDFRVQNRVILGSAPDLEEVGELAEYTNGSFSEDKTTLQPAKYGKIVTLSFEMMVNDHLGAFTNLVAAQGRAAMRKEADVIYEALISNALAGPALTDTVSLFDASRNNTVSVATTGKALTAAALGAARAKMRRQTAVGGGVLNLAPRVLIVPPERETEAEILVASSTIHKNGGQMDSATPAWIGGLIVVAEPRLANTDTFYLVADPNVIGGGEVSILGGSENSPAFEQIEEPRKDAVSWKVRHVFAAGFIDFRGLVKLTLTAA
jgi:hypothetical protein